MRIIKSEAIEAFNPSSSNRPEPWDGLMEVDHGRL